jgi:hypothetical protein
MRFMRPLLVAVPAGMFALPAAAWAVFLPSLKQGLPDPIPGYERVLLEVAVFCGSVRWMLALLALPIVGVTSDAIWSEMV